LALKTYVEWLAAHNATAIEKEITG
jgi:hypothetical protein